MVVIREPRLMQRLPKSSLTERELDVLQGIMLGYTSKKIGGTLFLSTHTVDMYCQSLYRKLGVSTRYQVFKRMMEIGEEYGYGSDWF